MSPPTRAAFEAADLIAGAWVPIPGESLRSASPAHPTCTIWSGSPSLSHVAKAVAAARAAQRAWGEWPAEKRFGVLRRFAALAAARVDEMAALIRDEVGKPMWDAKAEAQLLAGKVEITLDQTEQGALRRVTGFDLTLAPSRTGRCRFRPHGVMSVIGPFNFPMHLPNGHIIPALAMGNTIVFKPSDKAPACGQAYARLLHEALDAEGAPAGVLNLVHGGADIAAALTSHDDLDGVLFTGSWPVGRRIMEANLDRPGRLLALEMGGNNAAIVMPDADLRQAAIECVRCAFITAGQRCTCTRRVIVHQDIAKAFTRAVCQAASSLIIGDPARDHPVFMGPVISSQARAHILSQIDRIVRAGGTPLVEARELETESGGWFMSPGVMRSPRFTLEADTEVFGPFLQISECTSLDDAIDQANATRFGLAASIFTKDPAAAEAFAARARAGCLNVNTGTAGASSKLPFGGLGQSGNHRPAGAFSLDYCAYPVAGVVEAGDAATLAPGLMFDDAWLK